MDVHQLTSEHREELIEDLLALKDAVLIEESCPQEEECKGTLSEAPVTLQYNRAGVLSQIHG